MCAVIRQMAGPYWWQCSTLCGAVVLYKPCQHQQQRRKNTVECYKLNDSFDKVECCLALGQSRKLLWLLWCYCFWQHCRTKFRPFDGSDEVERNWTCSICFNFVKKTKFYEKLVQPIPLLPKTATISNQHSNLSKGRYFTINLFDIVAVFGNKIECCFDMSNVALTLLPVAWHSSGVDRALQRSFI